MGTFSKRFALGPGLGLVGYGLILIMVGVFASTVRGSASSAHAPIVLASYVQLAVIVILVPSWVTDEFRTFAGLILRVLAILLTGLLGVLAVAVVKNQPGWVTTALLSQTVVASFALATAGVSTFVLALLRGRLASQLVASGLLLLALTAPMLANPIIRYVEPAQRASTIDVVSLVSPAVVVTYAAGVDFYRTPGMYRWSLARDYPFSVPRLPVACALYLGVGFVLTAAFRPLTPTPVIRQT